MKRICFFSGDISRSGGTERVTSLIANGLTGEEEFEVFILSLHQENPVPIFKVSEKIKCASLSDQNISLKRHYLQVLYRLRSFLKREKIDVLIDVDVILDCVSIPAKIGLGVKLISWEHFHFYENLGCRIRDWGRWLARRYSDVIVVLTDADRKNYEKAGSRVPVKRIYNPVIPPEKEVVYDVNAKTILSVGRLTYQKGFDMIPAMAVEIFKQHPDWQWVILGDGEDRGMLEEVIRANGLENFLILAGRHDPAPWYEKSAFLVMTSRYEGFPMVLLEALGYGLPMIAFNCPCGPAELIKNNLNGFLMECFDQEEMVQAILNMMENAQKRSKFSISAPEQAKRFAYPNILNDWINLLICLPNSFDGNIKICNNSQACPRSRGADNTP